MKLSVIGTGYVGLVTGVSFANSGHDVFCVDTDPLKIESLRQGRLPFFEQGAETHLHRALENRKIQFSLDLQSALDHADLIFITVGTPPDAQGNAELSALFRAVDDLLNLAKSDKVLVIKSTVPVGTQQRLQKYAEAFLKNRGLACRCEFVSNPEFLREGSAFADFLQPDRILIGTLSDQARKLMSEAYAPLEAGEDKIIFTDPASSEMSKYAANVMLAARLTLMNEISRLCEVTGADIEKVKLVVAKDHRIGPHFLNPGAGFGGSCFPKDLLALTGIAKERGLRLPLLTSLPDSNEEQKQHLFEKIRGFFKDLQGRRIALWGLAFKPGTSDIRCAPSLFFIEKLLAAGASIRAMDPAANGAIRAYFSGEKNLHLLEDPYVALQGADALLILTEWPCFKDADIMKIRTSLNHPVIFDGRNIFTGQEQALADFDYFPVGRLP